MAVFSLSYNHKRLESFPIGMGDTFMIGRQSANDIVIDNLAVSFHHAKVESIGDEFLLIDLHSQNGSFVNDQRICVGGLTRVKVNGQVVKAAVKLNRLDVITLGKLKMQFLQVP